MLLLLWKSVAYLERSRTSKMKLSCENTSQKSSIIDVWVGSKYAYENKYGNLSKNTRLNFIHKRILDRIKVCI